MILFLRFCMMIGPNFVQLLGQASSFKNNNPGISRGLSVKKLGFWHFLGNATMIFLIFCMMIGPNTVQYLTQVSSFKNNNPGISRGLSVKKLGFLTFFRKRYYDFLNILHDNMAQHPATVGPGFRFQIK